MRKHIVLVILAALLGAVLLVNTVAFTVNELTDIVLIRTFGKTTRVYYGSRPGDAGLHFKWIYPVEELIRYDSRTNVFEDMHEQVATSEGLNVLLTMFCAWRIDDPVKFQARIPDLAEAKNRLRTLLRAAKKDVIGRRPMEQLVNTDPQKMKLGEIEDDILALMSAQASRDYGVRVEMVGMQSLGLPESVTAAVIETMKKERETKVKEYQTSGEARATAIRERAKLASSNIMTFAEGKAADIRSEGDRAAAEYFKEFSKSPELAAFLRSLEGLKKELERNSVILIDSSMLPAVRFFSEGASPLPPGPPEKPKAPGSADQGQQRPAAEQ